MKRSEANTGVVVMWRCPFCGFRMETTDKKIVKCRCVNCKEGWMKWRIKYNGKEL